MNAPAQVWLVSGGAGYIGSHVVQAMDSCHFSTFVIDDLSTGLEDRIKGSAAWIRAKCSETDLIRTALLDRDVVGLIHLAGSKQARQSVENPDFYWKNNVAEFISLLELVVSMGVRNVVFSSSSSVYGSHAGVIESSQFFPESPYARTKIACEDILQDYSSSFGLRYVALRYFNVVGCIPDRQFLDTGRDNVIPRFTEAAMAGKPLPIYGIDYPTPDGTCIRDYVDVRDVARAHVLAAQKLEGHEPLARAINLSTGSPTSVLEIARLVNTFFCRDTEMIEVHDRKKGDPAEVWAKPKLASSQLGWKAHYSLKSSIEDHVAASRDA